MVDKTISGRLQRSITVFSALAILAIGTMVALVSIVPLYSQLKEDQEQHLLFGAATRSSAVREFLSRAKDVAVQITSRTKAREELEAYNRGEVDLATFTAFSKPILTDALEKSAEVVGIGRLDEKRNPVIAVGLPTADQLWAIPDTGSTQPLVRGPVRLGSDLYLIVSAPILDRQAERVGTDVVLFSTSDLQRIIRDYTGLGETGEAILLTARDGAIESLFPLRYGEEADKAVPKASPLTLAFERARRGETGVLSPDDSSDLAVAFRPIPDSDWAIAVKQNREELYAPVHRQVFIIAALIAGLILLGTFGMVKLLRPLAGKVVLRAGELEYEVKQKTAALEDAQRSRKKLNQTAMQLRRTNRALMALSGGNRTVVRAMDEQLLLQDMCNVIVKAGGYHLAWVGYAEQNEQKTVRGMAQAGFAEEDFAALMKAVKVTWADEERGRGPVGTAIRTGKPYVARDILTDPNFAPFREEAQKRGYGSVAAFPLPVEGRPIGALAICHREPDAFDEEEMKLLEEMAEDLAYGIATLRTRVAHKEATAAIEHLAYHDTLTGLPNHVQLGERLQQLLSGAQNRSFALLLLGLNRFRQINDTLGFEHGNRVLLEIGPRMQKVLRKADLLARMRGDEFAVLLAPSDVRQAIHTAQQILEALKEPFLVGGLLLDVQGGVGIVLSPGHGTDANDLIRRADVALNQAKRSGADYTVYAAEKDEESPRHLALAAELRQAIEKDQLVLHYQPKIDMRRDCVCGAEALVRWQHPRDGMIPPSEFIGVAENTGLIKPLTSWVLEAALRQARTWQREDMTMPIAVNLSVRNLRDPKLVDSVRGLLSTWSIEPGALKLEITETALMEDPARALEALTHLSTMGIRLSIDDFGTGYSSLGYLNKLPVDEIKIDRSFVMDMTVNNDSAIIVRSTIDLAHDLGIKVVAEGVENQEVWDALAALHCDVAQGYHISKPVPAEEYKQWLSQSPWRLEERKVG